MISTRGIIDFPKSFPTKLVTRGYRLITEEQRAKSYKGKVRLKRLKKRWFTRKKFLT